MSQYLFKFRFLTLSCGPILAGLMGVAVFSARAEAVYKRCEVGGFKKLGCNKTGICLEQLITNVEFTCSGDDPSKTYSPSQVPIPADAKHEPSGTPNVVAVFLKEQSPGEPPAYFAAPCQGNTSSYCALRNESNAPLTDPNYLTDKKSGAKVNVPPTPYTGAPDSTKPASADPKANSPDKTALFAPSGGALPTGPDNKPNDANCTAAANGPILACGDKDHPTYYAAPTNGSGLPCTMNDARGCHQIQDGQRNPMTADDYGKSNVAMGTTGGPVTISNVSGLNSPVSGTSDAPTKLGLATTTDATTRTTVSGSGDSYTMETRYGDGTTATTNGKGEEAKTQVSLGQKTDEEKFDRSTVAGSDKECVVSSGIGGSHGCSGTRAIIETAKVTNVLGQTVGSVATAAIGQSQQQQAMAAGTQSAALRAAASTQRTSGDLQVGAGIANGLMGVVQLQRNFHHSGEESDFIAANKAGQHLEGNAGTAGDGHKGSTTAQGFVDSNNDLAHEIIGVNDGMNNKARNLRQVRFVDPSGNCTAAGAGLGLPPQVVEQRIAICKQDQTVRNAAFDEKKRSIREDVRYLSNKAAGEHHEMAAQAMAGGMMSIITGASQAVAGGFAIAAANQLDKAADNLAAIENTPAFTPGFTPLGAANMNNGDATAGGNGVSLNPSTGAPTPTAASSDAGPADLGTLGTPLGKEQKNDPLAGKAPGAFQGGNPGGGGGGPSGGGGIGGASTAPAGADPGDPQAKMADTGKGVGYDGGSGVMAGGGGGGAGADRGPDLSGLLAQFLPKKDEEKNGNGILDFGGRSPAAEGPISLLDRNANIFDRIHETYQDKNRRGRVGR